MIRIGVTKIQKQVNMLNRKGAVLFSTVFFMFLSVIMKDDIQPIICLFGLPAASLKDWVKPFGMPSKGSLIS
jgi:hypothetical protein